MQLKSRDATLRDAIKDWSDRGLVSPETTRTLYEDLGPARDGWGFQALVITLGALCLGFAAITFTAANWEGMTRLARASVIFAALWLSWSAAAFTAWRGLRWWAEALAMLSCALFGAAIMLVAQIYHIQGNAHDAVWLWAVGSLLAAALLRASLALALTTALFALWFVMAPGGELFAAKKWVYLATLAATGATSYWVRSRFAAHLNMLGLAFWVLMALFDTADTLRDILPYCAALLTLCLPVLYSLGGPGWLRGFDAAALGYLMALNAIVMMVTGFAMMDGIDDLTPPHPMLILPPLAALGIAALAQRRPVATLYDIRVAAIAVCLLALIYGALPNSLTGAAAMLALNVWITRMGWRLELRALRVIGISGFVIAMLGIYWQTVGSLIGTAAFYLGAGVLLLGGAWIGARLKPTAKAAP